MIKKPKLKACTECCGIPQPDGRELNKDGQLIPPKWEDMEVSTDPVDSGEDVPDDLASSSCKNRNTVCDNLSDFPSHIPDIT